MTFKSVLSTTILLLLLTPWLRGQTVSRYAQADAVVMQAFPDSVINQAAVNGNLLAYRHRTAEGLRAVFSYVRFDIGALQGAQVESAGFSYRGKTGDPEFNDLFVLDLYSLKADFNPDNLTWNNKPAQDKKLASSTLNENSARKDFVNSGALLVDYLNEAARQGRTSVGFLIRSSGRDSTSNMWLGGAANGNYAPVLFYSIAPRKSSYSGADAVVLEAFPDSVVNQTAINGNLLAYRTSVDGALKRVQSYVQFDISGLRGQQLETAGFSYRGKTGDPAFNDLFGLELYSLKAQFNADNLTWRNKPAQDKKLATSTLNADSGRKSFINTGTALVDYLNEEIRKGSTTVGFLIRSSGKDTTANMWLGGAANGNYAPVLDFELAPRASAYTGADAIVLEAHPDSVVNQAAVNGNLLAYRESVDGALKRVQSYVQFDISQLSGQQVESAGFSYRGKSGDPAFNDLFGLELYSLKAQFNPDSLTWRNKPAQDKKLATSTLNADSGRKSFITTGTALVDYLNEEIRKGSAAVGFLIRSSGKDSTSNMWLGGAANGNYAPVLDLELAPASSRYAAGDAVVLEAHPDSVVNQAAINGNLLAYRESVDGALKRVQSYVSFDISKLTTEVESAGFSYRGKTGDPSFNDLFGLELYSLKAGFNPDSLTWRNKPAQDKKLAASTLNADSGRKTFLNSGTALVDYLNEEIRKGSATVGFLIRSSGKDSTANMWLGGVANGNYAPVLDLSLPNLFTVENDTLTVVEDVYVAQAEPDVNFESTDADMHVFLDTTNMASKEIYLKFNISKAKAGIGTATLLLRGDRKDPPAPENTFRIQVFGADSDAWTEGTLTWNTRPGNVTDPLAAYTITESKVHAVSSSSLTDYVNQAIQAGRQNLTFVIRGRDVTTFRAWISSKNWVAARLALDYSTQDKKVLEDSYVAQASPDQNFDGVTAMQVARDAAAGNDRETYLKFGLEGARSNIVTATLILKADQERSASVRDNFFIQIFGVTDNSWQENAINWSNKPAAGAVPLLEFNINKSADHEISSAALTEYVKEAIRQKKTQVSFAVRGRDDTPGSNVWVSDKGWRPARLFLDYRQIVAAPVFVTPLGDYVPSVTVQLAVATPGASIYYTLDGSIPTDKSTLYAGGILLTDTTTIKAIAYAPGLTPSPVAVATYNVAPVSLPSFSPNPAVEYNDGVTVTIAVQPQDAFLFYSDDGGEPLTPYPPEGILLTQTTTIRARGVSADGNHLGPIAGAIYTIVNTVSGTGTGPAGVGAPDNTIGGQPENPLWLKADAIEGAVDGQSVPLWPDQSGNGNDAYNTYVEGGNNRIPNTGETQKPAPTFLANALNGRPVLQFGLPDGSEITSRSLIINDADNLDGGAGISLFLVLKRNLLYTDFAAVFQKRDITAGNAGQSYVLEFNGGANPNKMQFVIERQLFLRNNIEFNDQDYYIINAELQGDFGDVIFRTNGLIESVATYKQIIPAVAAPVIVGGFQPMNIAEVILYKKGLNAAQNVIVHNYLATKYGIPIPGDLRYYHNTEYTNDLIGIGKTVYIDEATHQEHRSASGAGMQIDVRSALSAGDFVLAAHNGAEVKTPANWERYWNIEVTGNAPNVTLSFDFAGLGMELPAKAAEIRLFYHDGNQWTDLNLTPTVDGDKLTFAVDAIRSGLYAIGADDRNTTAVQEIDQSDHLKVFPNPMNGDEVTLQMEHAAQGRVAIRLYDTMGRLLLERWVDKTGRVLTETLSLSQLPDGVYSLRLVQPGQYQAVRKVVKLGKN